MSERRTISSSNDTTATINRAIRLPSALLTDDGRRLLIRSWKPIIELGSAVSVTVEAIIESEVSDE